MQRINTPLTTRFISGSYFSLSVAGLLLLITLLALSFPFLNGDSQPEELTSLLIVTGGLAILIAAYFAYIFFRTGIFIDGDQFVERRAFKEYRLKMSDIKQINVASYANSSAAGNAVSLITDLDNGTGLNVRHLELMASKKRSWSVVEQIIASIHEHNPEVMITSPSSGRHSLWVGFDDYIASKVLARKIG